MARPKAIELFERMFLFSLLIGVVQAALGWDRLAERGSTSAMLILLALTFGTLGGLTLLVSRGRSRSSKWVLVALYVIGLPMFLLSLEAGTVVGWMMLALVQAGLQVAALGMLFTSPARAWLSARSDMP